MFLHIHEGSVILHVFNQISLDLALVIGASLFSGGLLNPSCGTVDDKSMFFYTLLSVVERSHNIKDIPSKPAHQ